MLRASCKLSAHYLFISIRPDPSDESFFVLLLIAGGLFPNVSSEFFFRLSCRYDGFWNVRLLPIECIALKKGKPYKCTNKWGSNARRVNIPDPERNEMRTCNPYFFAVPYLFRLSRASAPLVASCVYSIRCPKVAVLAYESRVGSRIKIYVAALARSLNGVLADTGHCWESGRGCVDKRCRPWHTLPGSGPCRAIRFAAAVFVRREITGNVMHLRNRLERELR